MTAHASRPDSALEIDPGLYLQKEMMPMRDGVRLATHLWFPAGEGPWPVILVRSPYGKGGEDPDPRVASFAGLGYVVVTQEPRGRFDSEGEDSHFINHTDIRDGYDAVEWLADQPWCTGKVGTWGRSGPGILSYFMSVGNPPHLDCQHIGIAASDVYSQAIFQGGSYRKALVDTWLRDNGYSVEEHHRNFAEHRARDAFWNTVSVPHRAGEVNVPILHWSGYWDIFCKGAIDGFVALHNNGGPGAKGKQKLVLGPWSHGIQRDPGELTFPHNALEVPNMDEAKWFNHFLQGEENDLFDQPPVAYYVMGALDEPNAPGNVWRTAENWPPESVATPWYLHRGGLLKPTPPTSARASRIYLYDPENPVPTLGGANLTIPKGSFDQRPVEKRDDVLVFTSAPLEEPLEITGNVRAKLFVSSSAPDTDFTAKLSDVYPDGRSMHLLDGIQRARYRNGDEQEERMEPGEVYEIDIDLWTTSIIINKGHRIRVAISSSNFPRFEPNRNTGNPWPDTAEPVVARNTIHLSSEHPSSLVLPVIPAAATQ